MKLKKPMSAPAAAPTGGATIADRFKLEPTQVDKPASKTGKASATIALIAAVVGLALVGGLVFVLYGHLEFLTSV